MAGELPRKKVNFSVINRKPKMEFDMTFKRLPFFTSVHQIQKPMLVFCVKPIMPHLALPYKDHTEFEIKFELPSEIVEMIQRNPSECVQLQIRCGKELEGIFELSEGLPKLIEIYINNHKKTAENSPIHYNCNDFLNLGAENIIKICWPFHDEPYYIIVDIVKVLPINHMIDQVINRNRICSLTLDTKAKALEIMRASSKGIDLSRSISKFYTFNLLCPITTLKMKTPTRSLKCNHLQCFDLEALFTLNKIKPTWKCPICHLPMHVNDLVIDTFLWKIVKYANLPDRCVRVVLYCNGNVEALFEPITEVIEDCLSESDDEHSENITLTDNLGNSNEENLHDENLLDDKNIIPKIEVINPDD
ncbi:PREDICTED: E3 SUMO-protein ligase pli1-like [Diuraphis noxia]|uniref:E3 SUMO-protein ligase pli1-like n=1 Tax=Diuraphis noxia TaxID=143948 RepID=UPI0007638756|nr:PREDICTED: E3 SUMO-protein ligase pli1-like [Diuraphis noxia]